jgi:spore coat protein A
MHRCEVVPLGPRSCSGRSRGESRGAASPGASRLLWCFAIVLGMLGALIAAPASAQAPTMLDPNSVPKYQAPLVIPPVMPRTGKIKQRKAKNIDYYEIAVREFQQQILPAGMPMTTVWSYGSANHPGTFNYPAFTIESKWNKPARVKWINDLVDPVTGNFLTHLLPVDQTLHWANPPGGEAGKDTRGFDPTPYMGPVPIVTHVHGAHVGPESDGYPEAWWLPNANDIPAGYATQGTRYDQYDLTNTEPGTAVFQYPNDQNAATLWYHDHTLGMTRANVYAGPAGFYIVRGGPTDLPTAVLPGPAPAHGDPPGMLYYEIPIVIQDRLFYTDGSLAYPDNRAFFEGVLPSQLQIPFIPDPAFGGPSDVSPIWNPEFFGNTMVVNGTTWPVLNVEPRRYRFRLLNGCNSRFLILRTTADVPGTVLPPATALPLWQIGSDGGFLPAPVPLDSLLIAPAERADVIVDFTGLPVGTEIYLINEGPDEPFGGGLVGIDFDAADPFTTGQVMKFVVVPLASADTSVPPALLTLPAIAPLGPETNVRQISLNEEDSATVFVNFVGDNIVFDPTGTGDIFGPIAAKLGTLNPDGTGNPLLWMDPITENPILGSTEIWEIHNFTMDAHPIHLHLVMFEVLDRTPMGDVIGGPTTMLPELWETGFKDTVIAYPGEVTRVKATFDMLGLYVWHCHIIEHEDNEMMRPYEVIAPPGP